MAILAQLRDHLDKGGIIFAATPNGTPVYKSARSFSERDFLANEKIVAPLEHLNVFTFKTLEKMGKSAGLTASHPPVKSLRRTTAAEIKGRLMKRVGLAREMAAQAVFRIG